MPLHFDIELDPLTYVVDVRRETTGFNCAPTDTGGEDPIQRLYRQSGGDWVFQATSREGTQPQIDWRGAVDEDGSRPVLYWNGPQTRYGSNTMVSIGGGRSIYRAGVEYARIPAAWDRVIGAAIYRHSDGTRKLRAYCISRLGLKFAVYQRTDGVSLTQSTDYPTDPDAWQLLGEIAYSTILGSYTDDGTYAFHGWAHWNQSGTALVSAMRIQFEPGETLKNEECSSQNKRLACANRRLFYRVDISGLAGAPSVTSLGVAGRWRFDITTTGDYTEDVDPVITCAGSRLVNHFWAYNTDTVTPVQLEENILAADWAGDTLVYARLELASAGYSASNEREYYRPTCLDISSDILETREEGAWSRFKITGFAADVPVVFYGGSYGAESIIDSYRRTEKEHGVVTSHEQSYAYDRIMDTKVLWADLRYGAIAYAYTQILYSSACDDGTLTATTTTTSKVMLVADGVSKALYSLTTTTTTTSTCIQVGDTTSLGATIVHKDETISQYYCLNWESWLLQSNNSCPTWYSADIDDSGLYPFVSCQVYGSSYQNYIPDFDPGTLYGLGASPRFTKIKWVWR